MRSRSVELLAPAGSVDALRAACIAGADAVYIGGNRFGARAYADNPDTDALLGAIDLVHRLGKRLYMTVNTLLKDQEMEEICDWFRPFYKEGVDAVIVQDLGVVRLFQREFPEVPLHGSTQMAVTGPEGTKLLQEMGIRRVIPARELSLKELKQIRSETGIELETFIHGALCYSYSGKCLMSSMIGGRSGNRGRCAGICRLPYRIGTEEQDPRKQAETYPLNMKDLCTLEILPELIEAGISSFKIEGRMKKPEYTAGVVEVYRRALDAVFSGAADPYAMKKDLDRLTALYNRDGFTEGYYRKHNGADMIALENEKRKRTRQQTAQTVIEQIRSELSEKEAAGALRIPVTGQVSLHCGQPSVCRISAEITDPVNGKPETIGISCEKDAPQKARTSPVTEESVREQFLKTGGSPFFFKELDIRMDRDLFVPVRLLKELRRDALQMTEDMIRSRFVRKDTLSSGQKTGDVTDKDTAAYPENPFPEVFANIHSREQLSVLVHTDGIGVICLPPELAGEAEDVRKAGKKVFLALPYVMRKDEFSEKIRFEQILTSGVWDGVIVRDLEEAGMVRRLSASGHAMPETLLADAVLYAMNRTAADVLKDWGFHTRTLSYELNERELRLQDTAGTQIIVYGRVPVMISAQCVRNTAGRCSRRSGWICLTDRTRRIFPVWCGCETCTNVIYNSIPTSLIRDAARLRSLRCGSVRLDFTDESPEEVRKIAEEAVAAFSGREKEAALCGIRETTRGHFRRGVE